MELDSVADVLVCVVCAYPASEAHVSELANGSCSQNRYFLQLRSDLWRYLGLSAYGWIFVPVRID